MSNSRDLSSEIYIWKQTEISQYLIKEIRNKIKECEKELCDGNLMVSPALEREYCRAIGAISSLKDVLQIIEVGDESE